MKNTLLLCMALIVAPLSSMAQEVKGDAGAGAKKIAMCIGCHGLPGYQSSFPVVYKVPKIAGQNAKYIVAALQAYAKGDRKHPTMRGIAGSLSEQDMADVAAFYEQQAKLPAAPESIPAAPANVAELLTKGACVSCHGANFSKPIDPTYPKLAGQHADYLTVALKSYKTERNNSVGRSNGVMAGQVKQFSNAELKAIANYIATLPSELATVPQGKFR